METTEQTDATMDGGIARVTDNAPGAAVVNITAALSPERQAVLARRRDRADTMFLARDFEWALFSVLAADEVVYRLRIRRQDRPEETHDLSQAELAIALLALGQWVGVPLQLKEQP